MNIKAALFDLYQQSKATYFGLMFFWILGFSAFVNALIGNSHAGFPFHVAIASLSCFAAFVLNEKKLADKQASKPTSTIEQ